MPLSRALAWAVATSDTDRSASLGLLVLRVGTGALLLVHGVTKLGDPAGHVEQVRATGIPVPSITGWLSLLGEVGLPLALAVGLLTRLAGALTALLMALTWLTQWAPDGLRVEQGGIAGENALYFAVVGLALALTGAGALSLDARLRPGSRRGQVEGVTGTP